MTNEEKWAKEFRNWHEEEGYKMMPITGQRAAHLHACRKRQKEIDHLQTRIRELESLLSVSCQTKETVPPSTLGDWREWE